MKTKIFCRCSLFPSRSGEGIISTPVNDQPDALIIQILFRYKTLHVSGIFFAHHQEFSTVHSALVSPMQVLMTASRVHLGKEDARNMQSFITE
jgi:hypothetical protein